VPFGSSIAELKREFSFYQFGFIHAMCRLNLQAGLYTIKFCGQGNAQGGGLLQIDGQAISRTFNFYQNNNVLPLIT
jgi:hypothetical protein